jgi:hypothetical protein
MVRGDAVVQPPGGRQVRYVSVDEFVLFTLGRTDSESQISWWTWNDRRAEPVMARVGWLPWMNPDGSARDECP